MTDGLGEAPGGVPSARSPLFGRQAEIGRARELLRGGARLVTLTGAGGIGKSRIAAEVCRGTGRRVRFLQLSAVDEASLPGALLRALVPAPGGGPGLVPAIASALAVLDTFEHVLGSAGLLDELIEACPDAQFLVTSRSRLRVSGENVVPVGALPGEAAVQMFCERARAVGGLREPGGDDQGTVAALCQLLDGSPLAIELAAARTSMFTPAALLTALRSGGQGYLGMLAGGREPARHRDMRSTIGWSYELLGHASQRLLRRLAVFPGSFDLDAAEAARGEPPGDGKGGGGTLDDLADLVDWHLVEPADGPAGTPRFRLLDVLRGFAVEQLRSSGEMELAQDGLLRWSLELAEQASQGTDSPAERHWLERIDVELPNLREALHLLRQRADPAGGTRLAEAIAPFWAHRGPMSEGRRWLSTFLALDQPGAALSTRARATATTWLVRLAVDEGELELTDLAAARDVLAKEPGADIDWLRATEQLAYGLTMRGELDAADELTEAGIERATLADLPLLAVHLPATPGPVGAAALPG